MQAWAALRFNTNVSLWAPRSTQQQGLRQERDAHSAVTDSYQLGQLIPTFSSHNRE